ncbi:nucleoside-diphosphate-sugar epimerase [Novosphingobium sp. Rr 2-17]|uniref:NAD-dependent epimerase/dehydratase family protein n=1 Tax=Novosphingobium sp. Rr 2-17 TaxID=555793 RepID=UPI000269A7A2|nr:NAD(P)-dependent oxidoreductase [Novosphingobium sp. Rr 2-17]EIZ80636.1 nucleoside-diphosphate-sugar epimerase [Novosphingobium sp. Rr 2-17]
MIISDLPVIALTGATGFLGSATLDAALAAGYVVRALTRRDQPERADVQWVRGDLSDIAALAELVRGAEAIVHVAGVVNAPDAAGFEEGNVTGTLNLIETVIAKGINRFVYVSSLSAREPDLSDYGASKAKAEKLVMASPLDWTIVRPPAIYGPRDKDMFELFRSARWGVLPMPREGRASMIHVEDLARLLVALVPPGEAGAGPDRVIGRVFEPDDGKPQGWEYYEMARAVGWAMGRRPWVLSLSPAMLARVARADKFLRGDSAKMTLDRAAYLSHPDWVVSPEASVPTGLWQPRIETRAGLAATARWYKDNKWL